MNKTILSIMLGISTLTLTACGGSGGNTASVPNPTPIIKEKPAPTSKITNAYTLWNSYIIEDTKRSFGATHLSAPTITVDGKSHGTTLQLAQLPLGLNTLKVHHAFDATIEGKNHAIKVDNTYRIYHQPNSVVLGKKFDGVSISGALYNRTFKEETILNANYINGNPTKTLPTTGTFHYQGKAFDYDSDGTFGFLIDFSAKTGWGSINLDGNTIFLKETKMRDLDEEGFKGFGFIGRASVDKHFTSYTLGIFGDNAEEVVGVINDEKLGVGFGGVKK